MNYILFEDSLTRAQLLPLTFVRPIAEIRIGLLTIREKWEKFLKEPTSILTENYLSAKYPIHKQGNNILINSAVIPNAQLVKKILKLNPNEAIVDKDSIVAMHITADDLDKVGDGSSEGIEEIMDCPEHVKLNFPWEIFNFNPQAIVDDYNLLVATRKSQEISPTNRVTNADQVFLDKGASVEHAYINASEGPVYIGRNAVIMEGAMLRGPLAIMDHATIKMGAKIYGGTTIGPHCKVGGEVSNSVFFAYSNKAHDGFVGHSVIAEWCNLGADTNTSDLKNTYDAIRIWSYKEQTFINTCQQFVGLIMGDHSKCGINTMFNSGTVVGVSANIFGPGFQRNFIPSFSWGGPSGIQEYKLDKALQVAETVYKRRNVEMTNIDKDILTYIHQITRSYRKL